MRHGSVRSETWNLQLTEISHVLTFPPGAGESGMQKKISQHGSIGAASAPLVPSDLTVMLPMIISITMKPENQPQPSLRCPRRHRVVQSSCERHVVFRVNRVVGMNPRYFFASRL